MKPKDKAVELVDTYLKAGYGVIEEYVPVPIAFAKQCALIAVDVMLNNAGFIWGGRDTETGLSARDEYRKYWMEVKQEILNLE